MKTRIILAGILMLLGLTAKADIRTIVISERALPYTEQTWFYSTDGAKINENIGKHWNEGRRVTSLAFTAKGWFVTMAKNTSISMQTLNFSSDWPESWIREARAKNYYITAIGYNCYQWLVVMSQDSRFSGDQVWKRADRSILEPWIQQQWNLGYRITDAAYDGTYWTVVMSKVNHFGAQTYIFASGDVNKNINEAWSAGYRIQLLNYGGGQFFLVNCKYNENNNRSQGCNHQLQDVQSYIQEKWDVPENISYIGGGFDSPLQAPAYTYNAGKINKVTAPVPSPTPVPTPTPSRNLATLNWIDFQSNSQQKNYTFRVGVKSDSKIEEVRVYVNGVQDRGIVPVANDGYDMTINRSTSLAEGQNVIKVVVKNNGGEAASERTVVYTSKNTPQPTNQQRRIALVMGNSNYHDADKRLKNPVNDATDLASKLESLGFTVIRAIDLDQRSMENTISDFGRQMKNYDAVLFYYAGHGVCSNGSNYLIPIDASLPEESYVKYKCINANMILDLMEQAQCQMKIVILDACRNNPFARSWNRGMESDGLGVMNAPKGTYMAFSTAPGDVALDGTGRNSPFTAALLQTLDMPNLSLTDFFQEVVEKVAASTNDRQNPWVAGSFRGKFYFNQK